MDGSIAIPLAPAREIAIDGDVVARALGLAAEDFRRLMEAHRIAVRCERGTREDEGLFRATFYHGPHYARLLVDRIGRMVAPIATDEA
jgi:hypothetical protein